MAETGDQTLLEMIATQEDAITTLNQELRIRDEIMRAAIKEADELHKTLSSVFLRLLASRLERAK